MEQWKKEVKALEEKRISFDLSYYRLAKMAGINIQKLKKVLEFKMIPNLKMYFDLKTVLDSHNVTVVGAEKVQIERTTTDETSFEEKGLKVSKETLVKKPSESNRKGFGIKNEFKINRFEVSQQRNNQVKPESKIKAKSVLPPPSGINHKIEECECTLVGGLLRRGKDGCKKLKSEHKF